MVSKSGRAAKHPERQNTQLEAAGAEFLVLGHMLIERIHGFKAYTRFPGYDIMAVDAAKQTSCRIQVKSRWATDFDRGFPVSSFEFDFVVLVALNRGYRWRQKPKDNPDGRKPPEFYVIPKDVARAARVAQGDWRKVFLSKIADRNQYRDAWHLIREFLNGEKSLSDARKPAPRTRPSRGQRG